MTASMASLAVPDAETQLTSLLSELATQNKG